MENNLPNNSSQREESNDASCSFKIGSVTETGQDWVSDIFISRPVQAPASVISLSSTI